MLFAVRWVKRKRAEKRGEQQAAREHSRRLVLEGRRARRMRDLQCTVNESKSFRFTEQLVHHFWPTHTWTRRVHTSSRTSGVNSVHSVTHQTEQHNTWCGSRDIVCVQLLLWFCLICFCFALKHISLNKFTAVTSTQCVYKTSRWDKLRVVSSIYRQMHFTLSTLQFCALNTRTEPVVMLLGLLLVFGYTQWLLQDTLM